MKHTNPLNNGTVHFAPGEAMLNRSMCKSLAKWNIDFKSAAMQSTLQKYADTRKKSKDWARSLMKKCAFSNIGVKLKMLNYF